MQIVLAEHETDKDNDECRSETACSVANCRIGPSAIISIESGVYDFKIVIRSLFVDWQERISVPVYLAYYGHMYFGVINSD